MASVLQWKPSASLLLRGLQVGRYHPHSPLAFVCHNHVLFIIIRKWARILEAQPISSDGMRGCVVRTHFWHSSSHSTAAASPCRSDRLAVPSLPSPSAATTFTQSAAIAARIISAPVPDNNNPFSLCSTRARLLLLLLLPLMIVGIIIISTASRPLLPSASITLTERNYSNKYFQIQSFLFIYNTIENIPYYKFISGHAKKGRHPGSHRAALSLKQ